MDFLEKKIKEERDRFDQIENLDEEALWGRIQIDRKPAKIRKLSGRMNWFAVAASVAILLLAGFYFFDQNKIADQEIVDDEVEDEMLPPELKAEAATYKSLVSEQKENLDFENIDKSIYEDIFDELALLDEIYQEFQEDLPVIDDQEKKVKILKKYYERKIRILERLSKEIEKKSHHEKRINQKPGI